MKKHQEELALQHEMLRDQGFRTRRITRRLGLDKETLFNLEGFTRIMLLERAEKLKLIKARAPWTAAGVAAPACARLLRSRVRK